MPYLADGRWQAPALSLGWTAIDWIETYLVHGPGDVQGEPIELDREFSRFIVDAYELDERGRRRVNRAFLSRSKGRAKSELAGMLACFEALGPARFDGFDADGHPIGRPIKYPFVRCLACEESQAGNTYDNCHYMLQEGYVADEYPGIDIGLTRILLPGGGEIVPSTASSAAKDGGKETFAVFDETHLYVQPDLHRMHNTVWRNLLKRKIAEPWALETSTMYAPGEGSIAEKTHLEYQEIAEGIRKDSGILFDHREAPPGVSLKNERELKKALKHCYGPASEWMDLDRMVLEIQAMSEGDARRYFLNQPVTTADQWMDRDTWNDCKSEEDPIMPGDQIAIGFDGSVFDDATGLVGSRLRDGKLFVLGLWESDGSKDWEVDVGSVDAAVFRAFEEYDVVWGYFDPYYWSNQVDRWSVEFGDKIVFRFPTNRERAMAEALERFHTSAKSGQLLHDGNPALSRHVLNARTKEVRSGLLIRKEHPKSKKKIDLAVAATLAFEGRGDAIADGRMKKRSRKVYAF